MIRHQKFSTSLDAIHPSLASFPTPTTSIPSLLSLSHDPFHDLPCFSKEAQERLDNVIGMHFVRSGRGSVAEKYFQVGRMSADWRSWVTDQRVDDRRCRSRMSPCRKTCWIGSAKCTVSSKPYRMVTLAPQYRKFSCFCGRSRHVPSLCPVIFRPRITDGQKATQTLSKCGSRRSFSTCTAPNSFGCSWRVQSWLAHLPSRLQSQPTFKAQMRRLPMRVITSLRFSRNMAVRSRG